MSKKAGWSLILNGLEYCGIEFAFYVLSKRSVHDDSKQGYDIFLLFRFCF